MQASTRSAVGGVYPDFTAVDTAYGLGRAVGALLTIVLVLAVLMLLVCAVTAALADLSGNAHAAAKARTGAWVALGTAILAGAAVAWAQFLVGLGTGL